MTCIFCEQEGGTVLWRDDHLRVVLADEPDYTGFLRVIWHAHVREMTDLAPDDRAHFMRVVFGCEAALRDLLRPDKINLASLGNLTPHLHWHVIPRFRDDAHFPDPVWATRRRDGRQPMADMGAIAAAIRSRLDGRVCKDML